MGRGLAAILPSSGRVAETESALRHVPVDLIRPNPDQPRKEFNGESLLALAESIEARGILQPLVVRALPGGTYELIAGERLLRRTMDAFEHSSLKGKTLRVRETRAVDISAVLMCIIVGLQATPVLSWMVP